VPGGRVLLFGALLVVVNRLLHVLCILWRPRDLEHGAGEAVDVSAKAAAMNRITMPTKASTFCNLTFAEPLGVCDGFMRSRWLCTRPALAASCLLQISRIKHGASYVVAMPGVCLGS